MDALPELEVVAGRVAWDWDMRTAGGHHGGINGMDTVASGFSSVSIRAASLLVDIYGGDLPEGSEPEMPAEEALMRILQHAQHTLRTCSLGLGVLQKRPFRQEISLQVSMGHEIADPSVYSSAAEFAVELQPYAAAAHVRVQVDEQSQVVHLTRMEPA